MRDKMKTCIGGKGACNPMHDKNEGKYRGVKGKTPVTMGVVV